jgi:hypothetical protein
MAKGNLIKFRSKLSVQNNNRRQTYKGESEKEIKEKNE